MFIAGFYNRSNSLGEAMLCQRASRQLMIGAYRNEREMLLSARDAANQTLPPEKPRIAFLFLVRGSLPHEPLWRRFFDGYDDMYSIYVHARPGFKFPEKSFFRCKEIPSKPVNRFSFNVVDAMRRLIAHALLDTTVPNVWFVFVCESSIPVRSFQYVYNYLMNSSISFVDSFRPAQSYYTWNTLPEFPRKKLRKGELWMALRRRHAGMVVAESTLYRKFKKKCQRSIRMCTPDEQYMQTLLAIEDPSGISNKTIMYVDWSHQQTGAGSPFSHTKKHISSRLIQKIQNRTLNLDGGRHGTATVGNDCKPRSLRFLFARKFSKDAATALQKLPRDVLGY